MSEDSGKDTKDRGLGPFFIESSRTKRRYNRRWLLYYYAQNEELLEPGRYPSMIPDAWIADPDPWWPRRPFTIDMRELAYCAELNYTTICLQIRERIACTVLHSNISTKDKDPKPVSSEYKKRSEEWSKQIDRNQRAVKRQEIVGLEGAETDGMKFLVFQTAEVPKEVLKAFLDTTVFDMEYPDTFRAYTPFSYLIVNDAEKPIAEYKGCTRAEDLDDGDFSVPEAFRGKSMAEIAKVWEKVIEPVTEDRSLIATHCFVILDEFTAAVDTSGDPADWVAKVAVQTVDGGWQGRPVAFSALKKGLLKGLETLMLDLGMLKSNDNNIVSGDMYGHDIDSVSEAENVYDAQRVRDVLAGA